MAEVVTRVLEGRPRDLSGGVQTPLDPQIGFAAAHGGQDAEHDADKDQTKHRQFNNA